MELSRNDKDRKLCSGFDKRKSKVGKELTGLGFSPQFLFLQNQQKNPISF